jgi:hypothetical protein
MNTKYFFSLILIVGLTTLAIGQQRVGINTITPFRTLDIYGSGSEYLRVHSSTAIGSKAGLELIRGDDNIIARDWKIENNNGIFRINTGTDNFSTSGEEILRINQDGNLGIGTTSPLTPLHIDGGEDASNTTDGYLMIGSKTGNNMIMDQNEIMSRVNGVPSTLYIQSGGGNTRFGSGNVYMGSGGGDVSIDGAPLNGRFNVNGPDYQIQMINDADDINDWYIGATNASWQTGDDQLVFSPNTTGASSTLRLKNVTENNGTEAPVMITSPSTQTLFFDGNEIDSKTPLYINQNSNENTYINPSGGKVGVGNSNPDGHLHISTTENGLGLQRDFATWWISPTEEWNLNFYKNTSLLAYVSYNGGGEYVAVSDRNLKENIKEYPRVMDKIKQLRLCSYSFIHDPSSRKDIGVIAQELEPLFPEAVSITDGKYGVAYDELTVIGIKGIQEQQKQLEQLSKQLDDIIGNK